MTTKVSAQSVKDALTRAIAALPADQRHVSLLVALSGLSYDEVAPALDVPSGTVSSRLNRARHSDEAAAAARGRPPNP